MADIDSFVRAEADSLVAELSAWCAIPSISTQPEHDADVRRSAEHLAGLLEAAGLHAEVLAVEGSQPAVYAEWLGAGPDAPTVTVYGHHDVQPVDPLDQWTTPPFEPTVRDGCLHARGASDDKGQVHFQVAAVRHLLAADGGLPVNLKFLVEGEERANFAALPFDPRTFQRDTGVGALPSEEGWSPPERIGGRPAADVNGVWGGYTGVGSKTVIPAEAHAKVSFRLVADQDPARLGPLLERWVRDNLPAHVQAGFRSFGGVKPCLTPLDHPANRAAARAVARAFGKEPLFNREGGSGPERALSDALGADCVYLGVMLPEDRIHAPNERLLLANYYRGVRAAAYTFEELARPEVAAALRAWRG